MADGLRRQLPHQVLLVVCNADGGSPGPVRDGAEMGDSEFVGA